MKLHIRKIIAREFLLLMLTIAIGFLLFLLTFLYNYYHKIKYQSIATEIFAKQSYADSLMKPFESKTKRINEIHIKIKDMFDIINSSDLKGAFKNSEELISFLSQPENVKETFELINLSKDLKGSFANIDEFRSIVSLQPSEILTTIDSTSYRHGLNTKAEVKLLEKEKEIHNSKILSLSNQIKIASWTFFAAMTIFFFIRYIYYALKWSWKTLKE